MMTMYCCILRHALQEAITEELKAAILNRVVFWLDALLLLLLLYLAIERGCHDHCVLGGEKK